MCVCVCVWGYATVQPVLYRYSGHTELLVQWIILILIFCQELSLCSLRVCKLCKMKMDLIRLGDIKHVVV